MEMMRSTVARAAPAFESRCNYPNQECILIRNYQTQARTISRFHRFCQRSIVMTSTKRSSMNKEMKSHHSISSWHPFAIDQPDPFSADGIGLHHCRSEYHLESKRSLIVLNSHCLFLVLRLVLQSEWKRRIDLRIKEFHFAKY